MKNRELLCVPLATHAHLVTPFVYFRLLLARDIRASPTALVSGLRSVKKRKRSQNIDPTDSASRWSSILASYSPTSPWYICLAARARYHDSPTPAPSSRARPALVPAHCDLAALALR
jgi:hypothetical protein